MASNPPRAPTWVAGLLYVTECVWHQRRNVNCRHRRSTCVCQQRKARFPFPRERPWRGRGYRYANTGKLSSFAKVRAVVEILEVLEEIRSAAGFGDCQGDGRSALTVRQRRPDWPRRGNHHVQPDPRQRRQADQRLAVPRLAIHPVPGPGSKGKTETVARASQSQPAAGMTAPRGAAIVP